MTKEEPKATDRVELIVTDKDNKIKRIVTTVNLAKFSTAAKNVHFCVDCGEKLMEIPLYLCEVCGQRYVARLEPKTGKVIIFAIGKAPVTKQTGIV